jgi:hypothetical protein
MAALNKWGLDLSSYYPPLNYVSALILFMILGMKNENTRRTTENKTLKDNSFPQLP